MDKSTNNYGVYYVPSKGGKLFAGLKSELLVTFSSHDEAADYCESCNQGGYIDELHIGYRVYPISNAKTFNHE